MRNYVQCGMCGWKRFFVGRVPLEYGIPPDYLCEDCLIFIEMYWKRKGFE